MRFEVSTDILEAPQLESPAAGGFVEFDGRVRNEHHGRPVVALEYEAYSEMAIGQGRELLEEAIERYQLIDAACVHRIGRLAVGESAVKIAVSAAHRRAAFEGCEYIIDELKRRVPIWKKEIYADGDSGWIGISDSIAADDLSQRLFEDARLRTAKVLFVGAGPIACAAIPLLAASGVGTIAIVDADRVEYDDVHRETLYGVRDVGRLKVDLVNQHVQRLWPTTHVRSFASKLTPNDLEYEFDVVIAAVGVAGLEEAGRRLRIDALNPEIGSDFAHDWCREGARIAKLAIEAILEN